jgi:sorbose reductase
MRTVANTNEHRGRAYKVNVTNADEVENAVLEQVKEFNGRLDVFVANSGIPWTQGAMIEGALDHYRDVMSINIDGVFYCARAAGRVWKRQFTEGTDAFGKKLENYSKGSFIATSSMSGHIVNIPLVQTAYNSSKAAVSHMCKFSVSNNMRHLFGGMFHAYIWYHRQISCG